jgi:hypothetical protein
MLLAGFCMLQKLPAGIFCQGIAAFACGNWETFDA